MVFLWFIQLILALWKYPDWWVQSIPKNWKSIWTITPNQVGKWLTPPIRISHVSLFHSWFQNSSSSFHLESCLMLVIPTMDSLQKSGRFWDKINNMWSVSCHFRHYPYRSPHSAPPGASWAPRTPLSSPAPVSWAWPKKNRRNRRQNWAGIHEIQLIALSIRSRSWFRKGIPCSS